MKRFLSFILTCVMMLGALAGCDNTPEPAEEHTFPDAEYAVNATDIAVVEDKIYYISGEKVYETASDAIVFEEFPAEFIASNGKELAVYGGGQVYIDGEYYTLPNDNIMSFAMTDGTLCWSYSNESLPMLGFYNLKNGNTISQTPLTGIECRVVPCVGTKILVLCHEISGEFFTYSFDTSTMKTGTFNSYEAAKWTAWRSSDEAYVTFVRDTKRLSVVSSEDGEHTQFKPTFDGEPEKYYFSGDSGIFLMSDGKITVSKEYQTPVSGQTVTILFEGSPNDFSQATYISRIMGRYETDGIVDTVLSEHDIEVNIVWYADADKIKQKQLAGDNDYDIYFTDSFKLDLNKPLYQPLNDYSAIQTQFENMFDEIKEMSTSHSGEIFGVPVYISVNNSLLSVDEALFEEVGLDIPEKGWTIDDFYELAKAAREKDVFISQYLPLWPANYIYQYGDLYDTHSLTDDGSFLRKMLKITKSLKSENLLYKESDGERRVLLDNKASRFLKNEISVIHHVTFDGTPYDMVSATFMQMNVNSQNKEAAATVIAEYMEASKGFDDPGEGFILCKQSGDAVRARGDNFSQNLDIYLEALGNFRMKYMHQEFLTFANAEAEKYYNDEQDLELTVEKIYARAKMIFKE